MRVSILVSAFIAGESVYASCNSNNCLRQLQDAKYSSKASAFCVTYTTTLNADPSAIPNYLGNCNKSPSAVSSACSCLVTSSTASIVSSSVPTITPPPSTTSSLPLPSGCHADNCLRALKNPDVIVSANAFCQTYTSSCFPDPTAIPTYLANCGQIPASVSSACSCFVLATPTPTPSPLWTLPAFSPGECGTTAPASGSQKQNFAFECGQAYDTKLAASVVTASSSDNCLAACDSQPGCAAMSFDTTGCTNNCYLFSSLTGLITVQSSTSDSASFACAALRGPGPSTCDSVLTGATDFGPYQVQCGVNYIGDSSLGSITAPGYTECFNACNANSHCSAFSFDSSICSNNCKLLAYIDDLTISSSSTVSSGFTPGNARDYSCGSAICGTSVNGAGSNGDGYLVACRSSYSFTQGSDIPGSPFTATSFRDCLLQCDNNDYCNYMSFDSSIFEGNCAMFERGGVSSDVFKANPNIDSAKALVAQTGGDTGDLSPDTSLCPAYDSISGTCTSGTITPYHHNTPQSRVYTYTASCQSQYTASRASSITSTLTVNTFLQCLDACDKNNHCSYVTFTKAAISTVDNCQFISGSATKTKNTPNYDSAFY